MQLGRPCTRTQTKHVPVDPASVVVLSASSPDEAELGSAYSLRSNDRGGSESRSISFTRLDLRESRVGRTIGDSYKMEDPRGECRV